MTICGTDEFMAPEVTFGMGEFWIFLQSKVEVEWSRAEKVKEK